MLRTFTMVAMAMAALIPSGASSQSTGDVVVMRRTLAPPRAKAVVPARTCRLSDPGYVNSVTNRAPWNSEAKVLANWKGTPQQAMQEAAAFCEGTGHGDTLTSCEAMVPTDSGKLYMYARSGVPVIVYQSATSFGREQTYAGPCS